MNKTNVEKMADDNYSAAYLTNVEREMATNTEGFEKLQKNPT